MVASADSAGSSFDSISFIRRFANRRHALDSVNRRLDEPTILELVGPVQGRRVLDVGCGLGNLAARIAELGAENVWGIDSSCGMIEKARSNFSHPQLSFSSTTIDGLAGENLFDTIVSSMVMHFVPELPSFLKTVVRLLKPGGALVFSQRHPIRTSNPNCRPAPSDPNWVVTRYFDEGPRDYTWLGQPFRLYHRALSTILQALANEGLRMDAIVEPAPCLADVESSAIMVEARAIPMILACKAIKP